MSREIDREVFSYCSETCPAVNDAFSETLSSLQGIVGPDNHKELEDLIDSLCDEVKKVGTEKLRDAMRACVSDKQDVERDLRDAQREIANLNSRVDDLENVVNQLEKELDACHS